jgi:hypothetical protein
MVTRVVLRPLCTDDPQLLAHDQFQVSRHMVDAAALGTTTIILPGEVKVNASNTT